MGKDSRTIAWFLLGILLYSPVFVIALLKMTPLEWHLQSDMALAAMRARDVGSNTPLVGPYSRYGWSHPGPALFLLMAVPATLTANPSLWVTVAGLLLKWFPLAASFGLIKRSWGTGPAAMFVAMTHLFLLHHRDSIWTIWNPTLGLALFTFVLTVVLTRLSARSTPAVSLLVSTVLIQFHVGYTLPAIPLVCMALWGQCNALSNMPGYQRIRFGMATVAPSLLLWAPPMWDQVSGTRNLSAIIRFFLFDDNDSAENVGILEAARIMGFQLSPYSSWNGRDDWGSNLQTAGIPLLWAILLLALAPAVMLLCATSHRQLVKPLALIWVVQLLSVLAISRSTVPTYPYLISWASVVGMMSWFVVLRTLWEMIGPLASRWLRLPIIGTSLVLILGVLIASSSREPAMQFEMDATHQFSRVISHLTSEGERVGVQPAEWFPGIGFGLMLTLENERRSVFVVPTTENSVVMRERMWGRHRIREPRPPLTFAVTRGPMTAAYLREGWSVSSIYAPDHARSSIEFNDTTPDDVAALLSRVVTP